MGASYSRQSSYTTGDTIQAADTNDEFDQILAVFNSSSGHTHDGTTGEGGPITKLLGNSLTFGAGTAGTDITITFDGETSDGVLKWMEDEDYFQFDDDIIINSDEKLLFRDSAIYINSSADGQLDIVADTEVQIATTTVDINGAVDISGTLSLAGTAITSTAAELNILDGVTSTATELNILDGVTATTAELNLMDGGTSVGTTAVASGDGLVTNDGGTMRQTNIDTFDTYLSQTTKTLTNKTLTTPIIAEIDSGSSITLDATTDIVLDAGGADVILKDDGTTFGSFTNSSGELVIKSGSTPTAAITLSGANATIEGNLTVDGNFDVTGTLDFSDSAITNVGSIQLDSISGDGDTNTSITFSGSDVITMATGGTTALTIDASQNVTIAGDLTVSGDDLTMGTNTSGNLLVADGTNFNSIAVGDLSEISTVANDDVFLAVDTSGGGLKKITRSTIVSGLATSGAISNVSEDSTPQLGGDLDVNGNDIVSVSNGNINLLPNGSGKVIMDGNGSSGGVSITDGNIDIRTGTGAVSKVKFYCESSNAHAQTLQAQPHSASSSAVVVLPVASGTLVGSGDSGTVSNTMLAGSIADSKLNTITTADKVSGAAVQVDGATDGTGITVADSDKFLIDDGGTTKYINASQLNTYISAEASAIAADNITTGDAAVTLATSAGNITIDAQGGDTDIIFKGTDGSSDITALTLDMSEAGAATFNNKVVATELDISGNVDIDGTLETDAFSINGTTVTSTAAELNILDGVTATATELNIMDGDTSATSTTVADADRVVLNDNGTMKQVAVTDLAAYFDDEITAMPNLTSVGTLTTLTVDNVIINGTTIGHTDDTDLITVADGLVTVAGEISVTTLDIGGTNVTSTAAELNILDGVTATATELNIMDGVTASTAELNIMDGVTASTAEINILDGVTATASEINLIDGGTARGTTALADGDGILINDAGTMRMTSVETVKTYMSGSSATKGFAIAAAIVFG
tara:strand:+ start:991 stop:3945 length:2955 start_codon:yes stop_codon:yes gene_type:complete